MQWYELLIDELDSDRIYSHKELTDILQQKRPDLALSTYHWSISSLVRDGKLYRNGYDAYVRADGKKKTEYWPEYSDIAKKLIDLISEKYPLVEFTIFETVSMNDFLNHLIAQNTVFVQVEKDCSLFVFRFLQEKGFDNLLYKPRGEDYDLYWAKNCIVVTNMISEAPLRNDAPHVITLEKMLVDMYADKLISTTYSKAEYPDVIEQADSRYCLDKTRMLRYARRRNRENDIKVFLEGGSENAIA
ncbi:MAG: hypothetical protein J6Y57_11170 [Lachnospiraceae bacterium]|nr:hypothetical protein [Lachnospiraceae bacterium]